MEVGPIDWGWAQSSSWPGPIDWPNRLGVGPIDRGWAQSSSWPGPIDWGWAQSTGGGPNRQGVGSSWPGPIDWLTGPNRPGPILGDGPNRLEPVDPVSISTCGRFWYTPWDSRISTCTTWGTKITCLLIHHLLLKVLVLELHHISTT